jgi:hypothetical protein
MKDNNFNFGLKFYSIMITLKHNRIFYLCHQQIIIYERLYLLRMKNIKRITILYILLILLIIAFANQGEYIDILRNLVGAIPYGDKWGHFFLMGLLAFFVNLLMQCEKFKVSKFSFLKGSVLVFAIVTLEETSQIFIENRSFDWRDLAFDYMGIWVFGQLARYLTRPKSVATD